MYVWPQMQVEGDTHLPSPPGWVKNQYDVLQCVEKASANLIRRYIDYCVVICREMSLILGVSQDNFLFVIRKKC